MDFPMRREEKYEYNQCIPEKNMVFFLSKIIEVRSLFFYFSEMKFYTYMETKCNNFITFLYSEMDSPNISEKCILLIKLELDIIAESDLEITVKK